MPSRPRPISGRAAAGGATLLAVVLTAAGCGGSSGPGVATLTTTTTRTTPPASAGAQPSSPQQAVALAEKYSACMRTHGVPDFPNPVISGSGSKMQISISVGKTSPQFVSAQRTCGKYLPQGGTSSSPSGLQGAALQRYVEHRVAFAVCMRKHGITNFPDPTNQGRFELGGTGISTSNPTDLAAARTCLPSGDGAVHLPGQ